MLNKFPVWKNIMLVVVIVLGVLYALPNIYGDVPAVQISGNSGTTVTPKVVKQVKSVLQKDDLQYTGIERDKYSILVRFSDTNTQFKARADLKKALGDNYTVAVNLSPATPKWLRALGANPMKLGLDLRGGIHFLLDVDVQGVIGKRLNGMMRSMSDTLRKADIRYTGIKLNKQNEILINFKDQQNLEKAPDALRREFPNINFSQAPNNPLELIGKPSPAFIDNIRQYTIEQTATTLRNRIDALGIAEPIVQQQGADRVAIDLPGVQDSARAKQILGGTATLEFHLVNDKSDAQTVLSTGIAPPGTRIYHMKDGQPILLDTQVVLSGNSITNASSSFGQDGMPVVDISLGGGGEAFFTKTTADNIGQRLAIVYIETQLIPKIVDGKSTYTHKRIEKVISAPVIQSALPNNFQITGIASPLEARNLALLLRSGAMPASVAIVQERTVGPSLGMQNIKMGIMSVIVAFALIVLFMLLYYRLLGFMADLALGLNLILILAIMSLLGMTLTLPGIAGIVLTVGIAVDANVLIFERIREELRNGVSPQAAIHAGFERAFGTIVDANVTTLIVAVILFAIGTGAVKGFAVTLTVGILCSMFTAVTFTRGLVNWRYGGKHIKNISIGIKV